MNYYNELQSFRDLNFRQKKNERELRDQIQSRVLSISVENFRNCKTNKQTNKQTNKHNNNNARS